MPLYWTAFFCAFANRDQSLAITVMYKMSGTMWDFNFLSPSSAKNVLDLIRGIILLSSIKNKKSGNVG